MPFRQIDLSQISTANSSNNQVIAVVSNTIVWANVTASGGSANPLATSIVGLNTANVTESTSNLYFTNARVYSNVLALLPTLAGDNITIAANGRISSTASGSASPLATSIVGLNTANVTESTSNLYFTNARVYSNIVTTLETYNGNINAGNIITGGATGGSLTGANLLSTNNISSLNWIGLYTANVIETSGNLYFTNARVFSNVISLLPTYTGNLSVSNLNITGGITDTTGILSITTTGGTNANIELVANGTGRIGLDGMYWPLTDGTSAQVLQTNGTGNLYWATVATTATSITGLNTANVTESASNLYFTNARVFSNVISLLPTYTGNINASNINITGRISANVWSGIFTANVTESASNLYYTNARVFSNVISLLPTYTGNLSAGNITITNRIVANVWSGIFTANVTESASNLYFTNARVYSNIVSTLATYTGNIFAGNLTTSGALGGSITGANLISANNFISTGGTITGANLISANNIFTGNLTTGGATGGSITGANLITSNNITVTNLIATNVNIIGGITDTTGILSITTTGGTNANIELNANGTGRIGLDGMYWPNADGTAGQILQTSGTGNLSWTTPSAGGGGGSGLFNSSITNSNNYLATNTLSNAILFSTQSILHSVYITNIDTSGSANIGVTATILSSGSNAPMLFNMPLPYRSSFEALKKPKVVNAGDAIQIQGLENGVGSNNDVHATIVYEEITSGTYTGINSNIATPYANVDIFTAASASIIESVMVSSTNNLGNVPITVTVTNSSNVIQGYMAYTLLVPVGATIELCEKPRRIASGHKIQAYTNSANAIAIFVAAKAV